MALIKCPECGNDVSTFAKICPHCGIDVKFALGDGIRKLKGSQGLKIVDGVLKGIGICTDTDIVIPSNVTSIGEYAFDECLSLTSITIPDSVTSIGNFAFYGCSNLTNITIPDSVISIGYSAFEKCTSLSSMTIPFVGVTKDEPRDSHFACIFGWNYCAIPESLKTVIITGGTSIRDCAFWGCTSLTSITIPNSVTSIGDHAFCDCSSLTSITIPNSVTSIETSAFYGCKNLINITIPDSVTSIGSGAFGNCYSLTNFIFTGTKAQWDAIEKGYDWNHGIRGRSIQCADGKINIVED